MLSPPDGLLDSSRPCNSVFIAQADMGSSVPYLRLKVIGELMDQGINQLQGLAFGGPSTTTYGSLPVSLFHPVRLGSQDPAADLALHGRSDH